MADTFPLGWLCVLPPLLTISLAIVTQRVVLSLLLGIVLSVGLMHTLPAPVTLTGESDWGGLVARMTYSLCEEHLWKSLFDESHLRVFAFTSLLGMQVALIHRAGGMQGIVAWTMPLARSRRGGQLLTWFLGLIIFIDDYANTLLLGSTMRPLTDRLKISREKLAFLVDSTAAQLKHLDIAAAWMPTIVFILASGIAFSTGTSWGTMAIVMPIIIPLVYGLLQNQLGANPPVDHYVLVASIGSVLAGAIFGDHCSPISDTTILSSRSSSCDHIAHVRTQMPYALTVGLVSIACGTLPAGFGVSNWWLLPVGGLAMVVILLVFGRRVTTSETIPQLTQFPG